MTHTASHPVPKQGIFRRAFAVFWAFLEALESGSSGYTFDRIERLEREVEQLKKERRQGPIRGPSMLTTLAPLGSNIDGAGESPRSAHVADQNGPIPSWLLWSARRTATPADTGHPC